MSEDVIRDIVKFVLLPIMVLISILLMNRYLARKVKKIKEIDGEQVILVSPATFGKLAWGGHLFMTKSQLIFKKTLFKGSIRIPLNIITRYEAKHGSLKITTQSEHYSFNVGLDINQWIAKLKELLPLEGRILPPPTVSEAPTRIARMKKGYIAIGIILIAISAFFIWSFSPTSYRFSVKISPLNELEIEVNEGVVIAGDIIEGRVITTEDIEIHARDSKGVIYDAGRITGTHNFKFTAIRDGAIFMVLYNPSSTRLATVDMELTVTTPELWPAGGIFFGVILLIGLALIIYGIKRKKISVSVSEGRN
jgi:hypothetical protein